MDFIYNVLITMLAHSIGVYVMRFVSGGRFKGEGFFAWWWAVILGSLILSAPFVLFTTFMVHTSGQ